MANTKSIYKVAAEFEDKLEDKEEAYKPTKHRPNWENAIYPKLSLKEACKILDIDFEDIDNISYNEVNQLASRLRKMYDKDRNFAMYRKVDDARQILHSYFYDHDKKDDKFEFGGPPQMFLYKTNLSNYGLTIAKINRAYMKHPELKNEYEALMEYISNKPFDLIR